MQHFNRPRPLPSLPKWPSPSFLTPVLLLVLNGCASAAECSYDGRPNLTRLCRERAWPQPACLMWLKPRDTGQRREESGDEGELRCHPGLGQLLSGWADSGELGKRQCWSSCRALLSISGAGCWQVSPCPLGSLRLPLPLLPAARVETHSLLFPAPAFPGKQLPGTKQGAGSRCKETSPFPLCALSHPITSRRKAASEGASSRAGPSRTGAPGREDALLQGPCQPLRLRQGRKPGS